MPLQAPVIPTLNLGADNQRQTDVLAAHAHALVLLMLLVVVVVGGAGVVLALVRSVMARRVLWPSLIGQRHHARRKMCCVLSSGPSARGQPAVKPGAMR